MKAYILGITVNGIKNIDKPCHLSFYKQTFKGKADFKDYNLKAIYGMNGAGKTGIIYAMDIYKSIMMDHVLSDSAFYNRMSEVINKKLKKFTIEIEFVVLKDGEIHSNNKYKHRIELVLRKNEIIISNELLESNKLKVNQRVTLYESLDGVVMTSEFSDLLLSKMINVSHKKSVLEVLASEIRKAEDEESILNHDFTIALPYITFVNSLFVFMNVGDTYTATLYDRDCPMEDIDDFKASSFNQTSIIISDKTDIIKMDYYAKYKDYISGLEKFMKLFRDDLVSIEVEVIEVGESYVIEKYFNYGPYRVSSVFESVGIKKLIKLYFAFVALSDDFIVFYDDLDANINDIYLMRLVEYVSEYTDGQLVFTTHNVGPMEVLKNKKKSIDFLTHTSEIVNWIKNGNYSVSNVYRSGMVEKHSFNVGTHDLIGALSNQNDHVK